MKEIYFHQCQEQFCNSRLLKQTASTAKEFRQMRKVILHTMVKLCPLVRAVNAFDYNP
jgi:hypothetical protein